MKLDTKLLRSMPILACVRDRNGIIIDATDRLLAESGLSREQAIGKRAVDVWPHQADFIAADSEALETGRPVARIEYSERSGRWFRSTHTPEGDVVVWVAEDASAEVHVKALQMIADLCAKPRKFVVDGQHEAQFVDALITRGDVTLGGQLRVENIAGACVRLLSGQAAR